jgi:hypothetical protein
MLLRVIARPYQRTTLYVIEAFLESHCFVMGEVVRGHELLYCQVHRSGLKLLTDGHDVHAYFPQVVQDFFHLIFGFSQADHKARLRAVAVLLDAT